MILRIDSPFRAIFAGMKLAICKFLGFRVLATEDEQEQRLNECEDCVELTTERQCRVCTCFIDAKVILATEGCPKKLWLPIYKRRRTTT